MSSRVRSGLGLAWLPAVCAVFAMVAGASGLAGWIFDAPHARSIGSGYATMKVNSAACCVLAGLSLLLQAQQRPPGVRLVVARVAAGAVVAVTLVTLLEYAIDQSLIDELFVRDTHEPIGMPGRMAPLTAIGLACTGCALLSLDARRVSGLSNTLPVLGGFLGLLALVGYVLGAEALYGIGDFTRVAPATALTLLLLSIGQLAARRERGLAAILASETVAGFMARRLLPAALIVPTVVGWVVLHGYHRGVASTEAMVAVQVLITIVMLVPLMALYARSLFSLDGERARIDAELRQSESKFRALAEGAREAIISANGLGRITYVNPGAVKMFGYSVDQALGQPLSLLMPQQFREHGSTGPAGVLHTHERQVMGKITESRGVRCDGEEFPLEISLTALGNDVDSRFTAIIRDVSERKRAERERNMLAAIVESSADAIYSNTFDGTISSWNRAAERIFGYSASEIVGEHSSILVPKALLRESSGILERVACGQKVDLPETTRVCRDGRQIQVWLTVSPVEDAEHTVVASSSIVRDLTERNQAQLERDRFFTVTHDLLCVCDADDVLRRVNPAFLRSLGHGEAELIGQPFAAFVHPEDGKAVRHGLSTLRAHTPSPGFTCRFRAKSGAYLWLSWVCNTGPDGRLYAAGRDVTERLAAEQRLRDAVAEKDVLLKEIHHRVKNNLQIISSLLNFQSRQVTDKTALAAFRESQDRVRSMALFHEKVYQAKDLAHVELADYLRQMAQMLRHTHGLGGAEIALNVRAEGVQIGVDTAVPCGLIANELITNSLKYAFPAGRRGSIDVELTRREGGGFVFVVADDGVGIPPEIDPQKSPSLGLQLVLALVEQMDGAIRLDRARGTRFEVTVPAAGGAR